MHLRTYSLKTAKTIAASVYNIPGVLTEFIADPEHREVWLCISHSQKLAIIIDVLSGGVDKVPYQVATIKYGKSSVARWGMLK